MDPKDVDVSIAGDTLTIPASRERHSDERNQEFELREVSYGRFEVKSDQIKAKYQNGVLELTMPASPERVGRRISVEIGTEEKGQLEHQAA